MENYSFDTLAVHAGYDAEKTTKSVAVPIYQTAAYKFDSTEQARSIFELAEDGYIYTRLGNPTVDVFEKRIAALDGGVGAVAAASGHAAMLMTALCLCRQGDEFVSSASIYGGAVNLFGVTLANMGITVRWADVNDAESFRAAINERRSSSSSNPSATRPTRYRILPRFPRYAAKPECRSSSITPSRRPRYSDRRRRART